MTKTTKITKKYFACQGKTIDYLQQAVKMSQDSASIPAMKASKDVEAMLLQFLGNGMSILTATAQKGSLLGKAEDQNNYCNLRHNVNSKDLDAFFIKNDLEDCVNVRNVIQHTDLFGQDDVDDLIGCVEGAVKILDAQAA
jgi:hypothetical protein